MRLETLVGRIQDAGLIREREGEADNQTEIDHLAHDSRKVGPNGMFVAIKGAESDGHLFIDKAVQNGAIAVVCEAMPANRAVRFPGIVFVRVTDGRAALAELSAALYKDPSRELTMIGVTGTNGKTTVTFLLHHLLTRLGLRTGMIGTIEVRMGSEVHETNLTTPDAIEINRLLRHMVDAGCTACAMEVSSHALDQDRVRSLDFDAAVFTNLTRDHLDYHQTFDAYLAAKKRLFDGLKPEAAAIYNADDPAGARMTASTKARCVSYGLGTDADIRGEIVDNDVAGLRLRIDEDVRKYRLVGGFNAYNLLAAYAVSLGLGHGAEETLEALGTASAVPGRFELMRFSDETTVVVDYAHTPDALENVLRTLRDTKDVNAKLWCVFGCGGDRDREKRPMMGAVAERYADRIIVTSDNPRTEEPNAIIEDIAGGLAEADRAIFITDRRAAIQRAARDAVSGDVVLIAGKGHETYQIVGTEKRPFDDREIARDAFSARVVMNSEDHP